MSRLYPYLEEWREGCIPDWMQTDLRPVIEAPEMRPAGRRCATTRNGTEIGRSYSRTLPAHQAGSVSGPHTKPTLADKVIYRFMVPLGALTVVVLLLVERFA